MSLVYVTRKASDTDGYVEHMRADSLHAHNHVDRCCPCTRQHTVSADYLFAPAATRCFNYEVGSTADTSAPSRPVFEPVTFGRPSLSHRRTVPRRRAPPPYLLAGRKRRTWATDM